MNPSDYADPQCKACDGEGVKVVTRTVTGTRWEDDGAGNPIPVPVPELQQELAFCHCLSDERPDPEGGPGD